MPLTTLPTIDYSPSADTMQDVFDDINLIRDRVQSYVPEAIDGSQPKLYYKILDIGDWNMDVSVQINVAHGLPDHTKIKTIDVMIFDDSNSQTYPLSIADGAGGGTIQGGVDGIGTTNISLSRRTGGNFDGASFNATSFNRGKITIFFTA